MLLGIRVTGHTGSAPSYMGIWLSGMLAQKCHLAVLWSGSQVGSGSSEAAQGLDS